MRRAAFLLLGGCTSLGPMPATTGIGAAPIGRTSVSGQVGVVPGFYASQSAQNDAKGQAIRHGSLVFEPGQLVGIPGLLVGGGVFGDSGDIPVEPYVGYRRRLGERLAIGAVGFGSTKRADENGASYHGVRLGGEVMASGDVLDLTTWIHIRAQAAVSATRVFASGRYCVDDKGVGIDCSEDGPNTFVDGKTVGVYPAATATLALDVGHHHGLFDGAQLAVLATAGRMPLVLGGEEAGTGTYASLGVTLTLALGLAHETQ